MSPPSSSDRKSMSRSRRSTTREPPEIRRTPKVTFFDLDANAHNATSSRIHSIIIVPDSDDEIAPPSEAVRHVKKRTRLASVDGEMEARKTRGRPKRGDSDTPVKRRRVSTEGLSVHRNVTETEQAPVPVTTSNSGQGLGGSGTSATRAITRVESQENRADINAQDASTVDNNPNGHSMRELVERIPNNDVRRTLVQEMNNRESLNVISPEVASRLLDQISAIRDELGDQYISVLWLLFRGLKPNTL